MDDRLIFLYYHVTELWGRRKRVRAGDERTGPSEVRETLANPRFNLKTLRGLRLSGKLMSWLPRKAAIVYMIPVP